MSKKSVNHFISLTEQSDKELMLTQKADMKALLKLINVNESQEDEALNIIKKEDWLNKITKEDFNRPIFKEETLLHFLIRRNHEKMLTYFLKYKDIDYSQLFDGVTLVQSALSNHVSHKILHQLIKKTPKESLSLHNELPYLLASNGLRQLSKPNKLFQKIVSEYVSHFKEELPYFLFQRGREKLDILSLTHTLWSKDGLTVLFDSQLFSVEQIKKAMNHPVHDPLPKEFFEPFLIKLEKKHLEDSVIDNEKSHNTKKVKI